MQKSNFNADNKTKCVKHSLDICGVCSKKECKLSIYVCLECLKKDHTDHVDEIQGCDKINQKIQKLQKYVNDLKEQKDTISSHIQECIKFMNYILQAKYEEQVKSYQLLNKELKPLQDSFTKSYDQFYNQIENLEQALKHYFQKNWAQFQPNEDSGDKLSFQSKESLTSKISQKSNDSTQCKCTQLQTQKQEESNLLCMICCRRSIVYQNFNLCQKCYEQNLYQCRQLQKQNNEV